MFVGVEESSSPAPGHLLGKTRQRLQDKGSAQPGAGPDTGPAAPQHGPAPPGLGTQQPQSSRVSLCRRVAHLKKIFLFQKGLIYS